MRCTDNLHGWRVHFRSTISGNVLMMCTVTRACALATSRGGTERWKPHMWPAVWATGCCAATGIPAVSLQTLNAYSVGSSGACSTCGMVVRTDWYCHVVLYPQCVAVWAAWSCSFAFVALRLQRVRVQGSCRLQHGPAGLARGACAACQTKLFAVPSLIDAASLCCIALGQVVALHSLLHCIRLGRCTALHQVKPSHCNSVNHNH